MLLLTSMGQLIIKDKMKIDKVIIKFPVEKGVIPTKRD